MWVLQQTFFYTLGGSRDLLQTFSLTFQQIPKTKRARVFNNFLRTILLLEYLNPHEDSHKHGAQFKEVIVLWVLHFNHSPWVQTTTDLLSFNLNQLVGANHSKGNTRLERKDIVQWIDRGEQRVREDIQQIKVLRTRDTEERINRRRMESDSKLAVVVTLDISCVPQAHLQDSGLLLEFLILVRVSIRQLIDFDPVLCNFIQDLMCRGKKDRINWQS